MPFTDIREALSGQPLPKLPARIRRRLQECGIDPETVTWGEVLTHAQFFEALKGNTRAFKEIVDRVEGKAIQRVAVAGSLSGIDVIVKHVEESGAWGYGPRRTTLDKKAMEAWPPAKRQLTVRSLPGWFSQHPCAFGVHLTTTQLAFANAHWLYTFAAAPEAAQEAQLRTTISALLALG